VVRVPGALVVAWADQVTASPARSTKATPPGANAGSPEARARVWMVSEPTPTAEFSAGAAVMVTLLDVVLPPLHCTVNVVEPVASQSPASLTLLPLMTTFTVVGGVGVTDDTVCPSGSPTG
jgi:hypothetical protein